MKLICFNLVGAIRWRIHKDDPAVLPAACFPGWLAVNPLIYPSVLSMGRGRPDIYTMTGLHEGDALIRTSLLVLAQPSNDVAHIPGFEQALGLLGKWRHVSRQALLSASILAIEGRVGPLEVESIPAVIFPETRGSLPAEITRRAVDGALTLPHLKMAAGLGEDFVAPIHDSMLLDAICAWLSDDYRKAILYAAIAVETLANRKLEEALTAAANGCAPGLRFVNIPARGGATRKDPVYEALAQGSNFARLLHERSLYLLNRSLLVDDQPLFSLALRLYTTRNKIAHRGEPSAEQSDVLELDHDGSRQALDCAIQIFRWYGEGQGYCLQSHETVSGLLVPDGAPDPGLPTLVNLGTMTINRRMIEVMAALPEATVKLLGLDDDGGSPPADASRG